jgi:ankyrin repeat protein
MFFWLKQTSCRLTWHLLYNDYTMLISVRILWVSLLIDYLWQECYTDKQIKAQLDDLPKDLNEIYLRCVQKIKSQQEPFASKILRWVSVVSEPFTMQQLREALAVDTTTGRIHMENAPTSQEVLRCCSNLIVKVQDETIVLAHHSVFQFLTSKSTNLSMAPFILNVEEAKLELACICVEYLHTRDYRPPLKMTNIGDEVVIPIDKSLFNKFMIRIVPPILRSLVPSGHQQVQLRVPNVSANKAITEIPSFFYFARNHWLKLTANMSSIKSHPNFYPEFCNLALEPSPDWRLHPWESLGQSLNSHYLGLLGWSIANQHDPLLDLLLGLLLGRNHRSLRRETFNKPLPSYDYTLPLNLAAKSHNLKIFKKLLDVCNAHLKDSKKKTALHHAAESNFHEALSILINKKVDKDSMDEDGMKAFHLAVACGSYAAAEILKPSKSEIDEKVGVSCQTALHLAAKNGHHRVLEFLIRNGAEIEEKDLYGYTALHHAVENNHELSVQQLLDHNANVEATIDQRLDLQRPMHIAAREGYDVIIRLLLGKGADINICDSMSNRPFNLAIKNKNINVGKLLVESGAFIDSRLLPGVAAQNDLKMVEFLLNHDVDINIADHNERTALHEASMQGFEQLALFLLDKEASTSLTSRENETALHCAIKKQHKSTRIAEAIIDKSKNLEDKGEYGCTPLHYSSLHKQEKIGLYLIDKGANINATDDLGCTALDYAIQAEQQVLSQRLVKLGANINHINSHGRTALHYAARLPGEELALFILENTAQIDTIDVHGSTALHYSIESGHEKLSKQLIEKGANLNIVNKEGMNMLHYVAISGLEPVAQLLIEKSACMTPYKENNLALPWPSELAKAKKHDSLSHLLFKYELKLYPELQSRAEVFPTK